MDVVSITGVGSQRTADMSSNSDITKGFAALMKRRKKSTTNCFAAIVDEFRKIDQREDRKLAKEARDSEPELTHHQRVVMKWHDELRDLMQQFNMDTTGCLALDKVLNEGN